jgi:hypothetical protein
MLLYEDIAKKGVIWVPIIKGARKSSIKILVQ